MSLQDKKYKECGICGSGEYKLTTDNELYCPSCGALAGYVVEKPPSKTITNEDLVYAFKQVFPDREPTPDELALIEKEAGNDYSRIAEELTDAVWELKKTGKLK